MVTASLTQEVTALHANICSAIADPNRILILYVLNEKPCSVNALAEELGLSQSTTSRHLSVLRDRGIITSQREGQMVVNSVADPRIIEALDLLRAILANNLKNQAAWLGSETDSKNENQ